MLLIAWHNTKNDAKDEEMRRFNVDLSTGQINRHSMALMLMEICDVVKKYGLDNVVCTYNRGEVDAKTVSIEYAISEFQRIACEEASFSDLIEDWIFEIDEDFLP